MSLQSVLGLALFTLVFTAFFAKCFSFLIQASSEQEEGDGLSTGLMLIGGIAMLMWYYRSWYPFVADWPGLSPLIFALALGIARYRNRDLFQDDNRPDEPTKPSGS